MIICIMNYRFENNGCKNKALLSMKILLICELEIWLVNFNINMCNADLTFEKITQGIDIK